MWYAICWYRNLAFQQFSPHGIQGIKTTFLFFLFFLLAFYFSSDPTMPLHQTHLVIKLSQVMSKWLHFGDGCLLCINTLSLLAKNKNQMVQSSGLIFLEKKNYMGSALRSGLVFKKRALFFFPYTFVSRHMKQILGGLRVMRQVLGAVANTKVPNPSSFPLLSSTTTEQLVLNF